MDFKKALIHQTPEERQAYSTDATTEAVKGVHETLKEISETTKTHATSADMSGLSSKFDELKSVTASNHPENVEMKLNDVLDSLDGVTDAIKSIPPTNIPEYPLFPEIPKTDLAIVEKLLTDLVEESKKPCVITLKII